MMAKYNPFNPNSVVSPSLFAGRHSQVLDILGKLAHVRKSMPASFVLHGERGIGKTALAKLIKYLATSNQESAENLSFLSSYYSIEKGQTLKSVLQASLNIISDQLDKTVIDQLSERLGGLFKGGKFTIGAFSAEFDQDISTSENQVLKDQIISILTNIIKSSDKSDGVLIIIDEIHNMSDIEGAAQIIRAIATTLDVNGYGKISFMIIGYSEAIESFFKGDLSAKRHFDSVPLSIMPPEEAVEVLTKGFEEVDIKYNKKEVEDFVMQTGGYPHSIQLLGHNVVSIDKDNTISKNDWEDASWKTAIDLKSKDFSNFYSFDGKQTLREVIMDILAVVGNPISKQKIKDLCGGKNIYQSTILGELKRSGAVYEDKESGELRLHSLLFRSAILNHIFSKKKNASHIIASREFLEN